MPYGKVVMVNSVYRHIEYFHFFLHAQKAVVISYLKIDRNKFQTLRNLGLLRNCDK